MPFTARALYELKSDVLYRVHVTADALHFVRVKSPGLDHVWTALFGVNAATRLGRSSREKRAAHLAELDAGDPAILVANGKRSFTAPVASIRTASIEPKKRIPWHGAHVALWRVDFEDGRALRLQFESQQDLDAAIAELRPALGERLTVSVS